MDKGIFYLICSVVTILSVVIVGLVVTREVSNVCGRQVVYVPKTVVVTPTVEPTATPSAVLRSLRSNPVTVAPVTKGVK